jgi:hypothetical protein
LQVKCKILDFDWILIPGNAEYLIKVLANTNNERIFNQAQIRVFVEFMWEIYEKRLKHLLFIPFIALWLTFCMYATYFNGAENNILDPHYIGKLSCLVIFGKMWFKFFFFEII